MDDNAIMFVLVLVGFIVFICLVGVLFSQSQRKKDKSGMTKMGEDIE